MIATYLPLNTIYAWPVLCSQSKVMNIAVVPEKQRHGYGHQLLEFSRQWAVDHGYRTIRIVTGTTSLRQLCLHQQAGFRVVAVEPDYFTKNYQQIIIEKDLTLRDRLVLELPIRLTN
ncbi:GNAT family N-acetyltransferase [Levilactobacillus fujinensis]|uniref:GNAT family N-acetyltransferase n=1 Tax=Levilactobacillus fujinensis TaxID=2486024 RepID=A0ABW1TGB7_9LACO|nr:GNAT family N-acetyltransferase [Levilactobacillus fujinensis]